MPGVLRTHADSRRIDRQGPARPPRNCGRFGCRQAPPGSAAVTRMPVSRARSPALPQIRMPQTPIDALPRMIFLPGMRRGLAKNTIARAPPPPFAGPETRSCLQHGRFTLIVSFVLCAAVKPELPRRRACETPVKPQGKTATGQRSLPRRRQWPNGLLSPSPEPTNTGDRLRRNQGPELTLRALRLPSSSSRRCHRRAARTVEHNAQGNLPAFRQSCPVPRPPQSHQAA